MLVVENKKKFVEFIQEIIKQINGNEGKFFLFDKNTKLKIHNKVEIIKNIFDLNINNYSDRKSVV